MQMVVVYFYLYPIDCLLVSDSDPFFSIDLHRLNTRAIAERFGNHIASRPRARVYMHACLL